MFRHFAKSVLTVVTILASFVFGGSASYASSMTFTSGLDLHLAPLVTPGSTFEYVDGVACFPLVGPEAPYKTLYFNDVSVTYKIDNVDYYDSLDYSGDRVGDTYKACTTPSGAGFEGATDVVLSGLVHVDSTFATNVATYFASKQITLAEVWFMDEGGRSTPQLTLRNETTKVLSYSISNLTIDGQVPVNSPKYLLVAPKSTTYLPLGSIAGSYRQDHVAIPATMTFTPVKLSTLTTKSLKLAKGLKLVANSVANWSYPSSNDLQPGVGLTMPCLQVKNATTKAITVKAALTWKAGNEKLNGTDGSVLNIPAGETFCIDGVDSNELYFEEDVRIGKQISVSGELKVVKASTFDTSGIALNGHAISGKPGMLYNSETKTTTIYLHVALINQESNSILSNPKVNGVGLKAAAVGGGCECGGGDILPGTRTVKLENLKGDLRIGKKLVITGTLSTSPEVSIQGIETLMYQDNSYGCFLYHPEQEVTYDPFTNTTEFKVFCYNHTIEFHNINLTGITAATSEPGKPNQVYPLLPGANLVNLAPAQAWTKRSLFRLIGDWRTGSKTLTILGVPVFQ
ncbi:MAG: hypothetical protein RLZZ380_1432 [Actinomycetota bacterium]|jgi:hypothetical protein